MRKVSKKQREAYQEDYAERMRVIPSQRFDCEVILDLCSDLDEADRELEASKAECRAAKERMWENGHARDELRAKLAIAQDEAATFFADAVSVTKEKDELNRELDMLRATLDEEVHRSKRIEAAHDELRAKLADAEAAWARTTCEVVALREVAKAAESWLRLTAIQSGSHYAIETKWQLAQALAALDALVESKETP